MYNILVCDDEKDIVSALTIYLTTSGYQVFPAYDGTEALALLEKEDIHLVLLDIMMPQLDGIATMTRLREKSNVPVILLTAKSEDTDKILGLNVGADDYVTKPFNPVEVLARVKSQLRRYLQLGGGTVRPTALRLGGVALDDRTKEVTLDGEPVSLTPREYEILRLLMQNPGTVFSPKRIYRTVWGEEPFGVETPGTSRWSGDRGTRWKGANYEKIPYETLGQGACLRAVRAGHDCECDLLGKRAVAGIPRWLSVGGHPAAGGGGGSRLGGKPDQSAGRWLPELSGRGPEPGCQEICGG